MSRWVGRIPKDLWAILGISLALILFFSPVWSQGRTFVTDGQFAAFFAPFSNWSNAWIGGWPAGADTAAYVWYPMRMLMPASDLGFNAFVLSAYLLAALGTYTYLRIVGVSVAGASLGGFGFALSGFMIAHLGHTSMIHATAWVPWMFAGVEGCLSLRRVGWCFVLAVAVAMACLAGHMQLAFYGLFFVCAYLAWAFVPAKRRCAMREWLMAVGGLVIGVLIAAPQLLTTLAYVDETQRASLAYKDFIAFSLPFYHLPTVFFPYLFGGTDGPFATKYVGAWNFAELCLYMPFALLVLAVPGIAFFRRADIALFWAAFAFLALVLALGGNVPPLAHLMHHTPGFNLFRAPARHVMEFSLSVACLAAFGFDWLASGPASHVQRRRLLVGAAIAGLVILGGGIFGHHAIEMIAADRAPWWRDPLFVIAAAAIVVALLALAVVAQRKRYSAIVFAIGTACAIVPFGWLGYWRTWQGGQPVVAFPVERHVADRIAAGGGRVVGVDGPAGGVLTYERTRKLGIPSVNWYGPLMPRRAAELLQTTTSGVVWPQTLFDENSALDVYGVRFVATSGDASERGIAERAALTAPRWRFVAKLGSISVYENQRALPLAWLCTEWRRMSPDGALDLLLDGGDFDPRKVALVEDIESGSSRSGAGAVQAKWDGEDAVAIDVDSTDGGFLVLSVNRLEGWRATVDGEAADIIGADYALMGLHLSKGRHRVRFEYRMPTWRMAAPWSAAMLVGVFVIRLARRTRQTKA